MARQLRHNGSGLKRQTLINVAQCCQFCQIKNNFNLSKPIYYLSLEDYSIKFDTRHRHGLIAQPDPDQHGDPVQLNVQAGLLEHIVEPLAGDQRAGPDSARTSIDVLRRDRVLQVDFRQKHVDVRLDGVRRHLANDTAGLGRQRLATVQRAR